MNLFRLVMNDDVVSLFCLYAILAIVGSHMVQEHPTLRKAGWRGGGLVYIIFFGYALSVLRPTTASALAGIAFRGLFAAGLACATGWILLSAAASVVRLLPKRKPPEEVTIVPFPEIKEPPPELQPPAPPPAPPPPPTPEERADAALRRYQARLQLLAKANLDGTERQAAQDRAKQQYLRELDQVMR